MVLRRLLRNHDLTPLLKKAKALLPDSFGIGVMQEETLVASAGLSNSQLQRPGALRFSSTFSSNGHPAGQVVVVLASNDSTIDLGREKIQPVADMVAHSLEMLLRQDEARRSLASDTLQKYRELSMLHRAAVGLNSSLRLREVGSALLSECQSGALPTEMGILFLRESDSDTLAPLASFGPTSEHKLDRITSSPLFADIMNSGKGEIINDLDGDIRWKSDVPGITALLAVPIVAADSPVGALVLATARNRHIEANHLQYITTLVSVAGTSMGNAKHFEGIQSLLKALLQALATAIDARDPFTAGHSHRVARLAVALARAVHQDKQYFSDVAFAPQELTEIYYAGLLHDVGKIGIREQVLTKSTRLSDQHMRIIGMRMALHADLNGLSWKENYERLRRISLANTISREEAALVVELSQMTIPAGGIAIPLITEEETLALLLPRGNLLPEERREIERHPRESYRILQHIPFPENMRNLLNVISQHHERLDGSGYPEGLIGAEISLKARILMVVDIYDAITMERHYKPALPREQALLVLEDEAAQGKLDPGLVRLMAGHIDRIEDDSMRMALEKDFDSVISHHQIN